MQTKRPHCEPVNCFHLPLSYVWLSVASATLCVCMLVREVFCFGVHLLLDLVGWFLLFLLFLSFVVFCFLLSFHFVVVLPLCINTSKMGLNQCNCVCALFFLCCCCACCLWYTHTHIRTHTYTHTHTHTYAHTRTLTHTHTRTHTLSLFPQLNDAIY